MVIIIEVAAKAGRKMVVISLEAPNLAERMMAAAQQRAWDMLMSAVCLFMAFYSECLRFGQYDRGAVLPKCYLAG